VATLITVLKGGGRYDPEWVCRLNAGARRCVKGIDRVLCLSDIAFVANGIEVVPLLHGWPGWWSKFEAFRPELQSEQNILFDLDTVFTANADGLAVGPLAVMEDYFLSGRVSTATMRWSHLELTVIYDRFLENPTFWMKAGSCGPVPNAVHGDQVVVDHLMRSAKLKPQFMQTAQPGLLDFYDPKKRGQGPVLVFIGDSKPDLAVDEVQGHWKNTSWTV